MNELTIIMYHLVRKIKNSKYPKIKGLEFSGFKRQLDYLENNYKILSVKLNEVNASVDYPSDIKKIEKLFKIKKS